MVLLSDILSTLFSAAFKKCGYEEALGKISLSNRLDLCQFQCNGAFSAAKAQGKSPLAVATEVVGQIEANDIIERIDIVPSGFINVTLKDDFLSTYVQKVFWDAHKGIPQVQTPETIVLDYGNPNVAKPLHVGHLRSAIIGEALKRIILATGRTAIGDVHLGDWGLPMGLVIAQIMETYGEDVPDLDSALLNEIYPVASQKSKEDEAFLQKARAITAQLQKGDAAYTAIWRKMVGISVKDIGHTFERLGVSFDYWYGESDSSHYVPELIQRLKDQDLLVSSEGAQVVEIATPEDKAPMPPVIVVKSNGSEGYATTDIATLIQRMQDFKPNQVWYVVDFRQNLHFNQVFRAAYKGGIVPESTHLCHLCFGTVNGKDGKPFKTRDGGVMQLNELLDQVTACAYDKLRVSDGCDEKGKHEIAEKIGIAAIKFGDLINHYSKDCLFDMDKFMASEGKTGVYLLYTIARINSILKKSDAVPFQLKGVYSESERELLLKLALSGGAFINAYNEKAPNILCESAYQIAVAFSKFYHHNHILSESDSEKKTSWLSLCAITKDLLILHLDTLGIEWVEAM